ncbi:MAG: c-type cytochrome domain-containing protein [Bacteroidia bacterium]
MKKIFWGVSLLFVSLIACKHEPVVPNSPIISFSNDVQPIIIGNCTQSSCHGNGSGRDSDRALLTYNEVINYGQITPGNAQNSQLYTDIAPKGTQQQMPPTPTPELSNQQILTIYLWILQGAKNN